MILKPYTTETGVGCSQKGQISQTSKESVLFGSSAQNDDPSLPPPNGAEARVIEEEDDDESAVKYEGSRERCAGCGRPATVCLCDRIPTSPIETSTTVVILQHPHEARHPLSTAPILSKCLRNVVCVVGRRLRFGTLPMLDSLYSSPPARTSPVLFLFPGPDSFDLEDWVASQFASDPVVQGTNREPLYLITFDATWKHAKEMVKASLPFISKFSYQVSLRFDLTLKGSSIFDSDLILRKEPFSGCVSTMEAVARSLRLLESNGSEIEHKLLSVLRAMVAFQACNLRPMKPRPHLLKKGR